MIDRRRLTVANRRSKNEQMNERIHEQKPIRRKNGSSPVRIRERTKSLARRNHSLEFDKARFAYLVIDRQTGNRSTTDGWWPANRRSNGRTNWRMQRKLMANAGHRPADDEWSWTNRQTDELTDERINNGQRQVGGRRTKDKQAFPSYNN